jgi:uncharacterized protein YggE
MSRTTTATTFAVFLAIVPGVVAAQSASTAPALPVVVTQGEAVIKRAPDQAFVLIGAQARAPKSADAQKQAADAMASLLAALKRIGLGNDAIKTTNYSLQPEMEYTGGTARQKGYIASNQVEVRVDALDKISDVLDAAGSSGATSISGLRFDVKDRAALEHQALQEAVRDAMARAQAMAAGAGRSLGAILRIEEAQTGGGPPRPLMMDAGGARMAIQQTPITPGDTEIRAQVSLSVEIR